MVSKLAASKTSLGIALRIHGDNDALVGDISSFLQNLERAYNSAYVLDSIIEEAEELSRMGTAPTIPLRNQLWMLWWPPTPEKVASMVPKADRLRFSSVESHSPGCWNFLGKLNPLDVIQQYLNRRQQDREYGSSANARSLDLENQNLELNIFERRITFLKQLGASDKDLALLREHLLAKSLQQLNPYQDQGLILKCEIVDPNIEKKKDRLTPSTTIGSTTTELGNFEQIAPNLIDQASLNKNEVITVDVYGQIISSVPSKVTPITKPISDQTFIHLVAIPGGQFWMGAPEEEEGSFDSERPIHRVTVSSFWMGQYPITQQQWQAVSSFPSIERELEQSPGEFKGPNLPVESVSWHDATEFCQRLSQAIGKNYRLPSEAEWEYACRARTTTPFYFGETITTGLANYRGIDEHILGLGSYGSGPRGEYREQTTAVDRFPPNSFGLYDMHGNTWEWCQDIKHKDYYGARTDGSAWIDNEHDSRIARGGSWSYSPKYCRSASRSTVNPNHRLNDIGFRIVCSDVSA